MSGNTFFKYLIFLVFITLVPTLVTIPRVFGQFQDDISEVAQQIPEFDIEDGSMTSDHEEYIHFTDTVALYFDPDDQLNEEGVIERNVQLRFAPLNIALKDDQLTFYVGTFDQTVPYSTLPDFNHDQLITLLSSLGEADLSVFLITLLVLFLFAAFFLFYQIFVVTLTNYFIALFSSVRLNLVNSFKVSILATTLPVVALSISQILGLTTSFSLPFFTIFSCGIFFFALRQYKKLHKENS